MVKADIKRNYYADLDLPTDATLDDIKRQYRKLGDYAPKPYYSSGNSLTPYAQLSYIIQIAILAKKLSASLASKLYKPPMRSSAMPH